MSASLLTFAGRILNRKKQPVAGALVELFDARSQTVFVGAVSSGDGEFRLRFDQARDPDLFKQLAGRKLTLRVVDREGRQLVKKGGIVARPGEPSDTSVEIPDRTMTKFKPFAEPLGKSGGGVLSRQGLKIMESAVSAMLPPGTPGHNRYRKAAICPMPEILVFDGLVDDAWGVLEGDPRAARRYRQTLDLIGEKLDVSRGGALPRQGLDLLEGAGIRPGQDDFPQAPRSHFSAVGLTPHPDTPFTPHPCLFPAEKFIPMFGAAMMVSRNFSDAAYLLGSLQHGLCGLDKAHGLLEAAVDGLARRDFGRFRGMLDHFGLQCGPDDGPIPPWPEPSPKPDCPQPPFPIPSPCEIERNNCLYELLAAMSRLRGSGLRYNISSLQPSNACPGQTVVITGANFGSVPGQVCFPFGSYSPGGTCVAADLWTDTEIRVRVPAGAGAGEVYLKILEDSVAVCGKVIAVHRPGGGATLFTGGRAAIGSVYANGQTSPACVEPDQDVNIQWNASGGGAGTTVRVRIREGASVLVDQSGLAPVGSLIFHTPASNRERTYLVEVTASHPCGNDSETLSLIATRESQASIEGMEITQGTQFYRSNQHLAAGAQQADNSVELIENKRTLVRVYVDSGLDGFDLGSGVGIVPGVNAQLHGVRGGSPLPGSPLSSINGPIQAYRNAPYLDTRRGWNRTINFELPSTWRDGSVTLRAVLSPLDKRVSGTVDSTANISFGAARALRLVGVMIRYTGWRLNAANNKVRADVAAPAFSTLVNAARWLRRTYPINRIQFLTAPGNETITFDGDLTDGNGSGCGTEWGKLMNRLRDLADDYSGDSDAVWVGVLPTGWGGAAWGGCGGGASGALGAAVIFANDAGPTLAQEVGHAYDRDHAPGCNAGSPDGNYPNYGYGSASIGAFGADTPAPGAANWVIQDPQNSNDFMSYCGTYWVSPYTYQGLLNGGISPSSALPAGAHSGGHAHKPERRRKNLLLIRGQIHHSGQVELAPGFVRQRRPLGSRGKNTGYLLEFCDEKGRSLEIQPIRTAEPEGGQDRAVLFFEALTELPANARELRVLKDDVALYSRKVSATAPKPVGLEVESDGQKARLRWQVESSSEQVWHKIRYSCDGGRSWLGIVSATKKTSAAVDLSRLPGGRNCLFEVFSSDGVATGHVRSKRFPVKAKPPRAIIAQPLNDSNFDTNAVELVGAGLDQRGRPIPVSKLRWSSSRDGQLGRGDLLEVRLSPGKHKIRLEVEDSKRKKGRASVEIVVAG